MLATTIWMSRELEVTEVFLTSRYLHSAVCISTQAFLQFARHWPIHAGYGRPSISGGMFPTVDILGRSPLRFQKSALS